MRSEDRRLFKNQSIAMKNHFQRFLQENAQECDIECICLHRMVSRIQTSFISQAVAKKSIIINEVDKNVQVFADDVILSFLLGCLISNAVCSTTHSCIHVETTQSPDGIQIAVRNNGKFDYSPGMHSLITMSNAASKLGGIIRLKSEPRGGFAIILSINAAA
jgi:hypothetical protein